MRIGKARAGLVVACLAYAGLVNWSYSRVEGVVGYVGMIIRDVPRLYTFFGFAVIALIAGFVMPLRLTRPSQAALWIIFLTWLVPCLLLIYHVGHLPSDVIFRFVLALTASFLLLAWMCRWHPVTPPRLHLEHTGFAIVIGLATLSLTVAVLIVARQTNLDPRVLLFDLTEVYGRRLEARRIMADKVMLGYGIATLSSSLAPICIAYGFLTRRHVFTALGAAGMLAIFAMDGTKSTIFVPAMLIGLVVLAKERGRSFGLALAVVLGAMVAISAYLWLGHRNLLVSEFLVRRVIVGKAITLGIYFETFRGAPVFMTDTYLMNLLGMQPSMDKSNIVGQAFGAGLEENWNGSAWAEMYGDFGIVGLLIASAVISFLLRCYDGMTRRAPFALVCVMAGFGAYVWGEAAVTTSILTYGVLATLVLLSHYEQPARRPSGEPQKKPPRPAGLLERPMRATISDAG